MQGHTTHFKRHLRGCVAQRVIISPIPLTANIEHPASSKTTKKLPTRAESLCYYYLNNADITFAIQITTILAPSFLLF